jgi:hypothetical protein
MQTIMAPPHIIVIGMPIAIIFNMESQRSRSISMLVPSIGIILQTMPSLPISMVIRHIIGIMPGIICMPVIGMPVIGMPIIGMLIIGIPIPFIAIPGIMLGIIGIIGIIAGIIEPMVGIIDCGIGIAGMFMAGIMAVPPSLDRIAR